MNSLLFSPLKLRDVVLPNRVVVPPMHQYSGVDGFPTEWHLVNAGKFACGGAGLVIIESTKVERRGRGTLGDLGLWDDCYIEPLARIARFIKDQGSVPGIQLGHTGRKARTTPPWEGDKPIDRTAENAVAWDEWDMIAPSALPFAEGWPVPRALELDEIPAAVQAWGDAARRADQAGFEVLEVHAAHGYLLHQFLSPLANTRTDAYGGSETGRFRFVLEVVDCVRANWPASKPLFMRLSVGDDSGWDLAQNVRLCRVLRERGVDVIDCSSGGMTGKAPILATQPSIGYQVPLAAEIRRQAGIATMAVGMIIHGDQAEAVLQQGQADLVAVGREMLYNPNWAMDAAQKLGEDPRFARVPHQFGLWLGKRAARPFGTRPSTWQTGLNIQTGDQANG